MAILRHDSGTQAHACLGVCAHTRAGAACKCSRNTEFARVGLCLQQAGRIKAALKNGFLKTDADLLKDEGMAECLKIRKEVARRSELQPIACTQCCSSTCSLTMFASSPHKTKVRARARRKQGKSPCATRSGGRRGVRESHRECACAKPESLEPKLQTHS
jgi:hypothetical protein